MICFLFILLFSRTATSYSNTLYTIVAEDQNVRDSNCNGTSYEGTTKDPIIDLQMIIRKTLFGTRNQVELEAKMKLTVHEGSMHSEDNITDPLAQVPIGNIMRAELFQQRPGVHILMPELVHRGQVHLKVTKDFMQTAIDAFAILLHGTLEDVLRLPQLYILRSARTIAMMNIEYEKLVAMWTVVKGNRQTSEITYDILEQYRPLFKYLTGKEMARLNLQDERIVSYIGTHAELNRHQVGVVASAYVKLNPKWTEARYLNIMNNLLCGVPMTFMRKISDNNYLQLTHQVFYHIRACDPLQRRFYLAMMTRTQALGKSYSWSARDVSRLGLLMAEVSGPDLSTIDPKSVKGITAQVMLEIPASKLKYFTEMQIRNLEAKPANILSRKLNVYTNHLRQLHSAAHPIAATVLNFVPFYYLLY